jgi:hypothetical protein
MFFEAQPRFNRSKPGGYFRSLSLFVNLLLNNKKSGQTAVQFQMLSKDDLYL